jgi:hypothetical protein
LQSRVDQLRANETDEQKKARKQASRDKKDKWDNKKTSLKRKSKEPTDEMDWEEE